VRGKLPTLIAVDFFGVGDLIGAVNVLNGTSSRPQPPGPPPPPFTGRAPAPPG
jgi:hypothetical protein